MSNLHPDAEARSPHASAGAATDSMSDIPRRLMRVKILYTFDDQNKSNCLARLPNVLSIPTVALDETTHIGVIELKTCIQAIVAASPELVAKLGHDYTVYAYDYSEYETPLVGQGMLSWILASASTTPNAPADQSQTMVTGRVCKNILGLFSNGIKETLEVKLKLVPVPTCMQSEYVENMERYHNLSKVMPDGMDYNAWAEFLKANPAIRQLAQSTPGNSEQMTHRTTFGGVESFHEMLTRPSPTAMNDSFLDQHPVSFSAHDTRASSPAMSVASLYNNTFNQDSRPASRASVRSEATIQFQRHHPQDVAGVQEQQEEGPPKKRARITKAKRPKKTALSANESLRVTASTAASVRLHRPVGPNPGAAVSVEQVPRAPTPRPGDVNLARLSGPLRPPAPSLLRHASLEESRPYTSPYDSAVFSDNIDSADDERASPGETPTNIPSSPPVMSQPLASSAPSSPELPMLPFANDSGFVSDIPVGAEDTQTDPKTHQPGQSPTPAPPEARTVNRSVGSSDVSAPPNATSSSKPLEQNDVPTPPEIRRRAKQDRSGRPWTEVSFGPPAPTSTSTFAKSQSCAPSDSLGLDVPVTGGQELGAAANTDTAQSQPLSRPFIPKARGLPRSHTWSGEPMSDAPTPVEEPCQPRSGSGASRRKIIRDRLEDALVKGEMPTYCNNCGEIDTPCWRKAFTRVEKGLPTGIQVSSKKSDIVAFEIIEPSEGHSGPSYRIFKQVLEPEEMQSETFTKLTLCNPCGLYLAKRNAMRPHEMWAQKSVSTDKPKRKRTRKKAKTGAEEDMSDAIIPNSEPGMAHDRDVSEAPSALDGVMDLGVQPGARQRSTSFEVNARPALEGVTAQAALVRAIQSSPVGLRGSKDSPVEIDKDLTPKPTRRLLFPSPRKPGEVKSLADNVPSVVPNTCAPIQRAAESVQEVAQIDADDTDKENCPPPVNEDADDLAHLFEDHISAKTTPTKGHSLDDLLKTPTPGSRRRVPLTPKRGADTAALSTPSRMVKTPRTGSRAATVGPETPFTRQLNAILSDGFPMSPSQAVDLSAFSAFNTPGRTTHFSGFMPDDFLSSDLPIPSSPPGGLGFSVFEDPNTSTVGLWSGASMFGSDTILPDALSEADTGGERRGSDEPALKMSGISVDFAAMIEEVVGAANKAGVHQAQGNDEHRDHSTEPQSSDSQGTTPDAPAS